ncbi:PAS domain-containing sensor histidine kinase [Paraburkholderia sp. DHOC27]|uniref:sensor histidine kinase n=1 Tax=Paraburkholderia sp. DHOC27 TaxID=2303330 RepID=UPI000E3CAF75|nr:PAS domain-containing sensor histidine kinase [Paraburkholderia sp. DHOC27]RFU44950.1 PAS domain-containing sensor histidine kinase [Paraburkholderia sp. DHOC27]
MDRPSREQAAASAIDPASVFDLLPDAYLILNEDRTVVLANASYLRMVDVTLSEVQGRSVFDINQFGPPEQRAERYAWLKSALDNLVPGEQRVSPLLRYDIGRPSVTGGGPERYWQIKAGMLASGASEGQLIALCVLDVSESIATNERNQRERAKLRSQARLRQVLIEETTAQLRDHQEQFQQALAFAHVGAWELNPLTGTIACTEQCKANLGLPSSAVLDQQRFFSELVFPDDRARVHAAMTASSENRLPFEVEYRVVWPAQSVHWILVRAEGRYLPDGTLKSMLGFTLDITTRKEAELEQQAIAESEKRAREESDRTARAMDHFVTAVSHELRSPLGAILSWSALLQRSGDGSHVARATDVIERNARQLSHMVDDLLDSGAIATAKLSVNLQPVDLGALAGNVAEDIRMKAEAKGLSLKADDIRSCFVMADESRMKQIVWNLLSNAVKFSAQGTIELSVGLRDGMAELCVRDCGCGIEPEALGRIFERFEQFGAAGGGRVGGLGLGLWLVKNLVDLHHGKVFAQSAGRGHGATFHVMLPLYH